MSKTKLIAATLVGSLLAAGAALAEDKKTIVVSIPAADHGWTAGVVYHANAAAKEVNAAFPNINVVVKTSPSAAAQVSALEDLSAKRKMDALVILPYSSEELTGPVKSIKEAGTFITVVDRGLNDSAIQDLYLAGDNIAVGKTTAKFLVDKLGGKGKVVVLRGIPTVIDDERIQGFKDGLAGSDIKILDIQYANWNRDDAFKLMQDYLAKYPQIDAVWANDDDMLLGVLEAVKQAKRTDIKFALGGNGMKQIIEKVMANDPMTPIETPYPPSSQRQRLLLSELAVLNRGRPCKARQ
jgi:ribose transport system substrate-binding protein